jgi:hypothetical protein
MPAFDAHSGRHLTIRLLEIPGLVWENRVNTRGDYQSAAMESE